MVWLRRKPSESGVGACTPGCCSPVKLMGSPCRVAGNRGATGKLAVTGCPRPGPGTKGSDLALLHQMPDMLGLADRQGDDGQGGVLRRRGGELAAIRDEERSEERRVGKECGSRWMQALLKP